MREWFSGRELAGLPGLPSTERRVRSRATDAGWQTRERDGRGGGREYHIASLPDATRVALLMRERRHAAPPAPAPTADRSARAEELWAGYERKSDRAKAEATRRMNAVVAVEKLVSESVQRLEAYAIVAHQLEESESTIRNWVRLVKGEPRNLWAPLLAPKWVGRTATVEYDDRVYSMFRDQYLAPSRPPATVCYRRTVRWAKAEGIAVPCYATLLRELRRREDPNLIILEREGERALMETYPYVERTVEGLYATQVMNADGHKLDLAVEWPDKERVRAVLLTVQDVYSRAIVGWKLLKSESAYGMSLTFLDAFTRVGVPKTLFVDNTLAAASKRITGGAAHRKRFREREGDPVGVMEILGVRVRFTQVAHGQSKPIERAFRTLADNISKDARFAGAYLGNNTQNKPANYGERYITIDELTPVVESEIAVYNTELGRRGGIANGESYQQVFERSYEAHAHEIVRLAPMQQRLLYSMSDRVTVDRRDGCVKLFGNRYWSEDLSRLKGTQVVLRYHPSESLHTSVWAYRLDGTIVGEIPIYHKAGHITADAGEAHLRAKRQYGKKKKDLAKARRHLDAATIAAMIPPVEVPALGSAITATKRIDFALPTTHEQLGEKGKGERRAATARVSASMEKIGRLLEPKRKRA